MRPSLSLRIHSSFIRRATDKNFAIVWQQMQEMRQEMQEMRHQLQHNTKQIEYLMVHSTYSEHMVRLGGQEHRFSSYWHNTIAADRAGTEINLSDVAVLIWSFGARAQSVVDEVVADPLLVTPTPEEMVKMQPYVTPDV